MNDLSRNIITFVLAVFLSAAVLLEAGADQGDKVLFLARKINRERMSDVYRQLNLSEEQKKDLEKNRKKYHDRIRSLVDKIAQLKAKISRELEESEIDQGKINALNRKLNDLQSELSELRLEGIMGVRNILSEDQYQRFNELTR